MAGEFDEALARQMRQLLEQIETGTSKTSQLTGGEAISASNVLDVLGANTDWLQTFEQRLEQQFNGLANRVIDHWMRHVDSEIRQSLRTLTETAIGLFEGETTLQASASDINDVFAQGGNVSRRLQGLVARSASNFVENLLTSTHTSTNESERSKQEAERFKSSRGQVSAELSRELSRGRRYQ